MEQLFGEQNLPIQIIYFALRGKEFKPTHLKTLLYIRLYYPDRFPIEKSLTRDLSQIIGCNKKTVISHLNILQKHNFLGYDEKQNIYYRRSLYLFQRDTSLDGTHWLIKVNEKDLKNFTEFIIAAIVAYRIKKYSFSKSFRPDSKYGGSLQGLLQKGLILNGYAPLSISYLAMNMNRSLAWVEKYKTLAIQLGYLNQKRDYFETDEDWSIRPHLSEKAFRRARKKGDKLVFVATSLISCNLYLKKGKKSV